MKVTLISFERLYNTGKYENEKYGVTAELEDGDDAVEIMATLKGAVTAGKEADEIPWGEASEKKPKKTTAKKGKKDEEEETEESEEENGEPEESEESDESESEEETGEESEEEAEEEKPKKVVKKKGKGSSYSRESDLHKKLFAETMDETMGKGWLKKNAGRAKTISIKLAGKDFLDAEGQVVDSFKTEMKKLAKAK